jgi:hypothetical protein
MHSQLSVDFKPGSWTRNYCNQETPQTFHPKIEQNKMLTTRYAHALMCVSTLNFIARFTLLHYWI